MNPNHRYQLEPYKTPRSRYRCPQCNNSGNTFTRYIDTETGQYINDTVGRCSRENNCGYHYTPKQFFANHTERHQAHSSWLIDHGKKASSAAAMNPAPSTMNYPHSIIPNQEVINSFALPDSANNLLQYLSNLWGNAIMLKMARRYHVGTSNHWPGACIFWQMDCNLKVRTGKIMLYNAQTGKRVKQPFNHIHWVHKKLYAGYSLDQCLFGEHLLHTGKGLPIAIVESEKTAIIASYYIPQYHWLATGGLHNLNAHKCRALQGRRVMLYPDVNALAAWQQKAADLELLLPGTTLTVVDFLECNATEKQRLEGWDLGDYFVGGGK